MDLNEMFSAGGLKVLKEELDKRVKYWNLVLEGDPNNGTASGRLEVLMKLLNAINEQLTTTTTELIPEYVPDCDHTFIMEATYAYDRLISQECVGWYYGKPDEERTKRWANRDMKATY